MKIDDQYLRVARIIGAHGLKGRLRLFLITDVAERFAEGNRLFVKIDHDFKPYICTEYISKGITNSIIKLDTVNDRDAAFLLKGNEIFILKSDAEKTRQYLDDDSFYYYDLIGCQVYWNNNIFGKISEIIENGEVNILVLQNMEGRKFLLPFTDSMVDTRNIFKGRVDINPIEGLLEEEFH